MLIKNMGAKEEGVDYPYFQNRKIRKGYDFCHTLSLLLNIIFQQITFLFIEFSISFCHKTLIINNSALMGSFAD